MNLIQRIKAPTPDWFKKIIGMGVGLAAVGTVLLTAGNSVPGFKLPGKMENAAQWMVVGGLVAASVSKTAKEDKPDA